MRELVEKRTPTQKVFDLGGGKKRLQLHMTPCHYKDENGNFQDVQRNIVRNGDFYVLQGERFNLQVPVDRIGYEYKSRRGGWSNTFLKRIGSYTDFNVKPQIEENGIFYPDVVPGIDIRLVFRRMGVEYYKYIKNDTAPTEIVWSVDQPADLPPFLKQKDKHKGWDSKNSIDAYPSIKRKRLTKRTADISTTRENVVTEGKVSHYDLVEKFNGRASEIVERKTRRREWKTDIVYPVVIDADITEVVAAGGDDHHTDKIWYTSSCGTGTPPSPYYGFAAGGSSWAVGKQTSVNPFFFYSGYFYRYGGGFRFTSVNIPPGATIDLATFKLNVVSLYGSGPSAATVQGIDTDNCAVGSSGDTFRSRTKTTASSTIDLSSTGIKSSTVTSIVQEIVDRGGWSSGNAIGLFVDSPNDPNFGGRPFVNCGGGYESYLNSDLAVVEAFESAGSNQAVLEIDYTESEVPTNIDVSTIELGYEAGSPDIGRVHILGMPNYTVGYEVGSPGMTQTYILAAVNAEIGHETDSADLVQQHNLTTVGAEFGQEITSIGIVEVFPINVISGEFAVTMSSPDLTQTHTLGVINLEAGWESQSADLVQQHLINVVATEFGNEIASLAIFGTVNVEVFSAEFANEISSAGLTQTHFMVALAAEFGWEAASAALVQAQSIAAVAAEFGFESESALLQQILENTPVNAEFGVEIQSIGPLVQSYNLDITNVELGHEIQSADYSIQYSLSVTDAQLGFEITNPTTRYFILGRTPARRVKTVVQK